MYRCSDPGSIPEYKGDDKLIAAIVLAVVTFWLFAQTTFNVLPSMRTELRIDNSVSDMAVSVSALFAGTFIVVAGGLADRFGRVKVTYVLWSCAPPAMVTSPCPFESGSLHFLLERHAHMTIEDVLTAHRATEPDACSVRGPLHHHVSEWFDR